MRSFENLLHSLRRERRHCAQLSATECQLQFHLDRHKNQKMPAKQTTHALSVSGKGRSPLISDEKFRQLYSALLQCKVLDQQLQASSGYERWSGREAATAGVVACLRSGDSVAPTPGGMLAVHLRRPAFVPIDGADVATSRLTPEEQLAEAAGNALRHKLERRGRIAAVFVTAAEPDRLCDVFGTVARDLLPFFCVVDSRIQLSDIPVIRVDGSDAVAVYRVAHESIRRAREGGGPTIMECAEWPEENGSLDPLEKLEQYLIDKKIFRADWRQQVDQRYGSPSNDVLMGSDLHAG
jgi:hypothetical protein